MAVRVVGSTGIRLHCHEPGVLMDQLGRPAKDIDIIVAQEHRRELRRTMEGRGYVIDRDLLIAMEGRRYSFLHGDTGMNVDVFVERLEFCHTIEVRERFDRHRVSIAPEHLLLQKLQIIRPTTTDFLDMAVLLATHELRAACEGDPEVIDGQHIAELLGRDWGFHRTATQNLSALQQLIGEDISLGESANARVLLAVSTLDSLIEAEPKSLGWRMRAKVGDRKQWWQDVDDRDSVY